MTPGLIGLACIALLIAAYMRGRGNLHKIGAAVDHAVNPQIPTDVQVESGPGGQSPLRLTRAATSIGKDVELLSATLLPGRGMGLLQITAMVPGHGEVPLLIAPPNDVLNATLNGRGADAQGENSMALGGAFELPWAERIFADSSAPGSTPGQLTASWSGTTLHLPQLVGAPAGVSTDGLFLNRASASVKSDVLPDGQFAQAVFHPGNFDGAWPSTLDVTVTAQLSAHTLDISVATTNTGTQPAPVGMSWHPLFQIPSGDRSSALLSVPSRTILTIDPATGAPTGHSTSVAGTALDFSSAHGSHLGNQSIDATYTPILNASQQPAVVLDDPSYNLSLQLIPMSTNIRALHIVAPVNQKWVSISPDTNLPDPFGREWTAQDGGMMTLLPGQTMEWKVRLQVSAIVGVDATQ